MRREYYLIRVGILLAVAVGLMATPALALVQHPNTVAYPNSEEPPLMSDRPDNAVVGWWSYNASAVAIAPNYILTTAHQLGGVGTTVSFGGTTYKVAEIFQHGKADLRIARITTFDGTADANLSSYVGYSTSRTEASQTAVIGGFGYGRGTAYPTYYTWAQTDNKTERWGQNKLETYATAGSSTDPSAFMTDVLVSYFDNYGTGNWVPYEAAVARFDSGGGWFLRQGGTGPWQVVGLSRGADNPSSFNPAAYMDCVRVSSYATWLDNAFSPSKWNSSLGGNWSTTGNWSGGTPNTRDKWAVFSDAVSDSRTVMLVANATIGTLRFDCPGNLTISATGSNKLTFDVLSTADSAQIETGNTNGNGSLTITAPLTVSDPLTVRHNSGGTLTISGAISGGTRSLTKAGTGTLVLTNEANTYSGGTTIQQGTLRVTNAGVLGTTTGSAYVTLAGATLDVQSDSALTLANRVKVIANSVLGATGSTLNVDRATVGPARTMTFSGALTTDGAVTLSTTSATGCSAAFSGLASITNLGAGGVATINTASADLALTGGLSLASGTLVKSGPKMLSLSGTQTYGVGTKLQVTAGSAVFSTNAGSSTARNLTVQADNASALTFDATQDLASIILNNTAVATLTADGSKVITTKNLNINSYNITNPTAKLDLKDNDLVVNYTGATDPVATIRGYLASGCNGLAWDGPGIASTTANSVYPTALGYIDNQTEGDGSESVLVKYTWYGDSNLDGVVDTDNDFSYFLDGLNGVGTSWFYGDYNYDGVVDTDNDFSLFLDGLNMQGGITLGKAASGLAESSELLQDTALEAVMGGAGTVPEPGTLLVLCVGVAGLLRRRRRC